jgi:hypothetical protein
MSMYDLGGTEVKGDAGEAILEIPQNRTLFIEKLTANPPVKPDIVEGLTNVEQVFEHFKPKIGVDFEDSSGVTKRETLSFSNLGDFGIKGITAQSAFLQDLTSQKELYLKMTKQLKSNKLLKKAVENAETKTALLNAIYALVKELEES